MLGAARISASIPTSSSSLGQGLHDLLDLALALLALLGDPADQIVIVLGLEVAQGQVLELPLEAPHAQAVGERRVDVQRLAARSLLPLGRQVLERAHVVEAVGELDEDDADVLGHRQEHLAEVLRLMLFQL